MYRRNAVFEVTEQHSCSLYQRGDEFIIRDSTISAGQNKPLCVWLVQELLRAMGDKHILKRGMLNLSVADAPGWFGLSTKRKQPIRLYR